MPNALHRESGQPLRSLLFVPADGARKIEKAKTFRPDGIIFDLEDAVALDGKAEARAVLSRKLGNFNHPRARVFIRVNGLASEFFEEDIRAAIYPCVEGIVLPKAETREDIVQVSEMLTMLERGKGFQPGKTNLLLLIESALGVIHAYELARSNERVIALVFGAEDFSADMGVSRTKSGEELAYARAAISHAARAARVESIDTVFTSLEDESALFEEALRSKQIGFTGKLLIHPRQIDPVHRAFMPSSQEVNWAKRVLEAFESAKAKGSGLAVSEGEMIDRPVVLQAQRILQQTALESDA